MNELINSKNLHSILVIKIDIIYQVLIDLCLSIIISQVGDTIREHSCGSCTTLIFSKPVFFSFVFCFVLLLSLQDGFRLYLHQDRAEIQFSAPLSFHGVFSSSCIVYQVYRQILCCDGMHGISFAIPSYLLFHKSLVLFELEALALLAVYPFLIVCSILGLHCLPSGWIFHPAEPKNLWQEGSL